MVGILQDPDNVEGQSLSFLSPRSLSLGGQFGVHTKPSDMDSQPHIWHKVGSVHDRDCDSRAPAVCVCWGDSFRSVAPCNKLVGG